MKWHDKYIKKINLVGWHPEGKEIYHVETKGGHHRMLIKISNNNYKILGYGSSRGHAKHMTDKLLPSVKWRDDLYKSEEKKTSKEFTPQDYLIQAQWYIHNMEKSSDVIQKLQHAFRAMHFLKVAECGGLDVTKALEDNLKKSESLLNSPNPPFDDEMMIAYYELAFDKEFGF